MPLPEDVSSRPVTVAPSRMAGGRIVDADAHLEGAGDGSACGSTWRTRPLAVTDGSSVRAIMMSASAGAVRITCAGTSKTASQPGVARHL